MFYRDTCRRRAEEEGVSGWVRNLPDGRVEAVFEGEEGAVDRLIKWCHEGTDWAAIESVEVFGEDPRVETGFRIR